MSKSSIKKRLRMLETQGDGSGGIFVVMSPLGSDKEQGGLFGHTVNGAPCSDEQSLWIMAREWRSYMSGRGSKGRQISFGKFLFNHVTNNPDCVPEHRRGDVLKILNSREIAIEVDPWPKNAQVVLMWEN